MLLISIYLCFFYQNLGKQPHSHEKLVNTLDILWKIQLMKEIFYRVWQTIPRKSPLLQRAS